MGKLKLIMAMCVIATICTYYFTKSALENSNIGSKDQLLKRTAISKVDRASNEDILMKIVSDLKTSKRNGTEANLKNDVDEIFANVHDVIIYEGLEPLQLSDDHFKFDWSILLIQYHGEIALTDGLLFNLSSIHRGGDVVFDTRDTKYLVVTVPIALEDLQFIYDYSAKLMGLKPTGKIEGKIADIAAEAKIRFDAENLVVSFDGFKITHLGSITVKFSGNALTDWMLNIFLSVITSFVKPAIMTTIESFIGEGLDGIVTNINHALNNS